MMEGTVFNRPIPGLSWQAYLLAAGILGTLALFIFASAYSNFPGDEGAIIRFQALRTGWLDDAAVGFANLGLLWVFPPAGVLLFGGLTLARRYADLAMAVAGVVVIAAGHGLKELVDRPRPEFHMVGPAPSGLSFPSGHALVAVIVGGVLVYLVGKWVKPPALRWAIQAGLILAVIAMGASRVYMGVHWPSDVIGSYVFGAMALVGLIGLRNAVASAR